MNLQISTILGDYWLGSDIENERVVDLIEKDYKLYESAMGFIFFDITETGRFIFVQQRGKRSCFEDYDYFKSSECPFKIETYDKITLEARGEHILELKNATFLDGMRALCKFTDDWFERTGKEQGVPYERHTNYLE